MDLIKRKLMHYWSDHKVAVIVVAIALAVAIIV